MVERGKGTFVITGDGDDDDDDDDGEYEGDGVGDGKMMTFESLIILT